VGVLFPAFALMLGGSPVGAAAGCPSYWADRPLRCAWGYVQIAPAGLLIPLGDVRNSYAQGPRLGYSASVGAGLFRVFRGFGLALGGRIGYGFTRQRFPGFDSQYDYLHAGPELRIGGAGRRGFAFGLLRAGYSQWEKDVAYRLSIEQTEWIGGHVGVGVGAWARLGGRSFVGGECVTDLLFSDRGAQTLSLSLVLGLWL